MKCPHCFASSKAKVQRTRTDENAVWRARSCGVCFKTFVTREEAPKGLRMPSGLDRGSARAPKLSPGQKKFDTSHLQGLLK